jgi:hypothetical protein
MASQGSETAKPPKSRDGSASPAREPRTRTDAGSPDPGQPCTTMAPPEPGFSTLSGCNTTAAHISPCYQMLRLPVMR